MTKPPAPQQRPMTIDHHDEDEDHDLGLVADLPRMIDQQVNRRRMFGLLGGVAAVGALAACGNDQTTSSSTSSGMTAPGPSGNGGPSGSSNSVATGEIPEETAGPFPGDGSNGANVLNQTGVVRSDIRSSFGGASGVAEGVPLTIRMKVYDLNGETSTVLKGAAIYAWHCDRDGNYSMYSEAVVDENYLRGVQESDDEGFVEFTTIFPGCYAGRWPHVHFEVYPSVDDATNASNRLRTSQLAFPQDVCETVYGTSGYESSIRNLGGVSLDTDMVFADGYSLQMAKMTGDNDKGYVATLNVPV